MEALAAVLLRIATMSDEWTDDEDRYDLAERLDVAGVLAPRPAATWVALDATLVQGEPPREGESA